MLNTVKISSCELINADCLEFIRSLPENSVDLIVTDPPYFKVKPEGWDNQWKGDDDYLKWLDQCLAQFWRVLKPAGSLYLFCGHRLASDIEIMMRERFSVLNHIIWAKPSGRWNGCNKESLRAYFPATERILFAEHYQGPYRPKDAGYAVKGSALKQHVMAPLISYFRDARGPGDNGKTDCRCHRKEKHGVALVQCQSVAATERKRLSEITVAVCPGGRRETSAR
ncbi:site-specific DNA-methyltransferase [Veillonella parvula]|uniref:DNA-methyltransferase n=1 Tax=Veillonella parvula TaxID=29466 RepID=UPI000413437E|nr:site-specific DNA-methyltransferase [Veillonella parvula]MDU3191857.1 DNA methyltransferase [Veillonella parvula]